MILMRLLLVLNCAKEQWGTCLLHHLVVRLSSPNFLAKQHGGQIKPAISIHLNSSDLGRDGFPICSWHFLTTKLVISQSLSLGQPTIKYIRNASFSRCIAVAEQGSSVKDSIVYASVTLNCIRLTAIAIAIYQCTMNIHQNWRRFVNFWLFSRCITTSPQQAKPEDDPVLKLNFQFKVKIACCTTQVWLLQKLNTYHILDIYFHLVLLFNRIQKICYCEKLEKDMNTEAQLINMIQSF